MSQQSSTGRGGRQTLTSSKYGQSDDGVTVKTLSSSSSSQHASKKLYTARDDVPKYKREASKSSGYRNGEISLNSLPQKSKFSNSSAATTTSSNNNSSSNTATSATTSSSSSTSVLSNSNGSSNVGKPSTSINSAGAANNRKDSLASGASSYGKATSGGYGSSHYNKYGHDDRRKHSSYDSHQGVEVRTHRSNDGYRNSSSRPAAMRLKPDRGHSSAGSVNSRSSRTFTAEKIRSSPDTRGNMTDCFIVLYNGIFLVKFCPEVYVGQGS